jgi:hypothetical protein
MTRLQFVAFLVGFLLVVATHTSWQVEMRRGNEVAHLHNAYVVINIFVLVLRVLES